MTRWPLSYLDAAGPAATPLTQLAQGLGAVSVAVVAIIAVALLWSIWRRRPPAESSDSIKAIGPPTAGLAWIYWGVGLSVVALAACTIWTLIVLGQVMHPPTKPLLTLQVTAHKWWWEIRYLSANGEATFTTANEIHIPAGEPVRVELSSGDVIHSFWAPKLGGKMDVIPGVTNVTWIEASSPGLYRGECGEYCGLEHARMAFTVVADTAPAFSAWASRQRTPPSSTLVASAGGAVFSARCASCHTVSGTPAGGIAGPDLGHLAGRLTLAAGAIPNDASHLAAWIANPPAIKPGVEMPIVPLSSEQRDQVVAYLEALT